MKKNLFKALCLVLAVLLLPVPVRAETVDTFNANAFGISGGENETPILVNIGSDNDAVLRQEAEAGRTADATVDCGFSKAYVIHDNEVMESSLADGRITFAIPESGDYEIVPGNLIKIANTNMVFGNSLALNFWIRKNDLSGSDYYAVVTKHYADGRAAVAETIGFADWENYSDTYYRVSCRNIAAKEMADSVTVQLFYGNGSYASYLYTDSVRHYAMDMLKYYRSGKLATALVDMLNYGAAAQTFFGYNEADLANSQLSAAQQALATKTVNMENKAVPGAHYLGATLVLEENIVLKLYFEGVTEDMYAEISFVNHYGEEKTRRVDSLSWSQVNKAYAVVVDDLVVSDGRQMVSCTVYNADGSEFGSCQYSVESYLCGMQNSNALYPCAMKFIDSAYAYFH